METILITGINGFLGSSLAKSLMHQYDVIGMESSEKNVSRIANLGLNVIFADSVGSVELFAKQRINIIIHTATSYGRRNENVRSVINSNLTAPLNLLELAIEHNCEMFINTDTVLDRFTSEYSLSKRHFQEWLYFYKNRIKVINMRLEHFYGPGASVDNFIITMIERLRRNETEIDLTPGEQLRDFVFIKDVVSAYEVILGKRDLISGAYNEYRVATMQPISIKNLVQELKSITGSTSRLKFGSLPYRENELMHSDSDNAELVKLGWKPGYSLVEGLRITANGQQ